MMIWKVIGGYRMADMKIYVYDILFSLVNSDRFLIQQAMM